MKKNKESLDDVNIMEGIDFTKSFYRQRKNEKTRRIQAKEKKRQEIKKQRKELVKKIALTFELVIVSISIYVLTGYFGELAQESLFYRIMCVLSWVWLIFGQIGALYTIWCEKDENGNIIR